MIQVHVKEHFTKGHVYSEKGGKEDFERTETFASSLLSQMTLDLFFLSLFFNSHYAYSASRTSEMFQGQPDMDCLPLDTKVLEQFGVFNICFMNTSKEQIESNRLSHHRSITIQ